MRQNINDLDVAIKDFLHPPTGPPPYIITGGKSLNESTGNVLHTLEIVGTDPPLEFSVRAGEIIHHLRSALDHIVWQLVETNSTGIRRHTPFQEFPVSRAKKQFDHPKVRQKIEGISGTAVALIESLQPFNTHPDAPDDSPLRIVHALDIRDKHHGLNVIVSGVRIKRVYVTDQGRQPGQMYALISRSFARSTETGTEIVRTNSSIENSHVDVNAEMTPEIAFDEVRVGQHEPVIPHLLRLTDAFAATIDLFRCEFVDCTRA